MKQMRYRKYPVLFITIIILFMSAGMAYAAGQSSTNYTIERDVIDGGGGSGGSTNYNLSDSTGQSSAIGPSSSSNYNNYAGFWYGIDTTPPTGTISINSDAAYTNTTSVTLTLACTDSGSGCSEMKFSNNGTDYSTAETYSTSKSWTLTSGDGTKTVYAKFKDTAGNWSIAYSDTIVLDTIAPTTTASPAGGIYTTAQSVTLTCSDSGSGCGNTYYCLGSGCTPATAYSGAINISTTTDLKFYSTDNAGKSESVKTETYVIDTTAPTGTISINSGAASTNSTSVTLTLSCSDASGCAEMILSNDGVFDTEVAEAYSTTKSWTLTGGDGTKTVYAKFKDGAGNWSGAISDNITLNTALIPSAPSGISLPNMKTTGPTVSWNTVDNATTYNVYRSSDNSKWTYIDSVSHPTNSYTDTSAPESNTLYYWTVTASNADGESAKPAGVSGRTALIHGWNQISAPYNTDGSSPTSVYGSWASYTWAWTSTGNIEPDNNGYWYQNPGITPGLAQFTWAWNDSTVLSASGPNNSASLDVILIPGWNMISNPTTTNMTDIGTNWLVDGSPTLSTAISNIEIGGDIYWWNGSTYDSMNIADNPTVEPWKGYWILNLENVNHTLTITITIK